MTAIIESLKRDFELLKSEFLELKERLDIVEEQSISQDLRIEDLEAWQEKIDDEKERE